MTNTLRNLYERNLKTSGIEVEARFGNFNAKGFFTPGVSKEQFINVIKYLEGRRKHFDYACYNQKVIYFKNGKRSVLNIDDKTGYAHCYLKKTLGTENINDYGFRLAVSSETSAEIDDSDIPQKEFTRVRYSYSINGYFRFDLSECSTGEYHLELESLGADFKAFDKNINLLLHILQESKIIITRTLQKKVLSYYNKISRSNRFIGVQPATINNKNFKKNEKYAMTMKMDGMRNLCICFEDELYLISSKLIVKKLGFKCRHNKDFILDGEFFRGNYHVFDAISYHDNLKERLEYVSQIISSLEPHEIRNGEIFVKKYDYEDIGVKFATVKPTIDYKMYDGIIFVKSETDYKNSAPLKWKPVEKITIDLQVEDGYLMAQGKSGLEKFTKLNSIHKGIKDHDIIEWSYDTSKDSFVPVRHRYDKLKPNFITVAKDNMASIISPFDEQLLAPKQNQAPLVAMRKFHNWVKRKYIENYKGECGTVLDLASGQGGDLGKYIDSGIKQIFGFDINEEYLEEAKKRKASFLLNPDNEGYSITLERADLSKDTINISEKADLVVCNFAFHYFYNSLDVFVSNVLQNAKPGAYILLTLFDKNKIQYLNNKTWSISKAGEDEISVHIKGSVLDRPVNEYLVDIDKVCEKFSENGISKVEQTNFEELYKLWASKSKTLCANEKKLSFMNHVIVFRINK
jgi:SAM-dependent methyltransferase